MADVNTLQTKIENLIDLSNKTTGENNTTLTSAVNSLITGYGVSGDNKLGQYFAKTLTSLESKDFGDITYISENCFKDQSLLKTVDLRETNIHTLYRGAFEGCGSLEKIRFDNGPYAIQEGAFRNCFNLSNMDTYLSVYDVGNYAFENTNISEINLTLYGNMYGGSIFAGCPSLRYVELTFNNTFGNLGSTMFADCENLKIFWIGFPSLSGNFIFGERMFANTALTSIDMRNLSSTIEYVSNNTNLVSDMSSVFKGSKITKIYCSDGTIPVEVSNGN